MLCKVGQEVMTVTKKEKAAMSPKPSAAVSPDRKGKRACDLGRPQNRNREEIFQGKKKRSENPNQDKTNIVRYGPIYMPMFS